MPDTVLTIDEINAMSPEQLAATNRHYAVKIVKRIAFRIVAGVAVMYVVTKLVDKVVDSNTTDAV